MKFTYIHLMNYIGIYQGCFLNELHIDFTKCKNRICIIKADNGGGKSTLIGALQPFPDSNDCFIPEREGYKELGIDNGGVQYIIRCEHPVDKHGKRGQTRAYIKKQESGGGFVELNTTGNIGSFKDIVDAEFGLDPNFAALSALSTEDKGLVEKTSTERKKYVLSAISKVELYNNINKVLTKRNSINKGIMNNLSSKIENIGNEEILKSTLISVENRINNMNQVVDSLQSKIVECDSKINIMDPNYEIQKLDSAIRVELESVSIELNALLKDLQYIFDSNPNLKIEDYNTIEKCNALYYEHKNKIELLKKEVESLTSSISNILAEREEETKALVLKTQRLESLKSEYNYVDLETSIAQFEKDIIEYEEFFKKANIADAISISKDEYISGLETLKKIKDLIDIIASTTYANIIQESIKYIRQNKNPVTERSQLQTRLDTANSTLLEYEKKYSYMEGMAERSKELTKRPSKCKINDCPFIKDLIEADKLDPAKQLNTLGDKIRESKSEIEDIKKKIEYMDEILEIVSQIKIILRMVDGAKGIIKKLPNSKLFLDRDEFLNRISKGSQFNEIDDIYQYINYANVFEEYKIAKDTLYKLKVDYKIYESKNEIIEELDKDMASIQIRLSGLADQISDMNNQIQEKNIIIEESEKFFKNVDVIISTLGKIKEAKAKKIECEQKKSTISSNMEKINILLAEKENASAELFRVKSELKPILQDRDSIKYDLKMLEQYQKEFKEISASFNTIEVLKKYSTPSKKGIQNIFIKLYMNQSLNLANQILSLFFGGKLALTGFIIGEEGFYIPAISNYTGMPVDDIRSCSRSEKTMASLALSAAMFKQSSTRFNIFRLDEIDEGLDATNRLMYIEGLNTVLDILEVEQCFIISHSSELSLGNVDIIKLRIDNDTVIANEGNIIYSL